MIEEKPTEAAALAALGLCAYRYREGRMGVFYHGRMVREIDPDGEGAVKEAAHVRMLVEAYELTIAGVPKPELWAVIGHGAKMNPRTVERLYTEAPHWYENVRNEARKEFGRQLCLD